MSEQSSDYKPCPYCGEQIRAAAILCRFCNRPLPGHEHDVPPPTSAPMDVPAKRKRSRTPALVLLVLLLLVAIAGAVYIYKETDLLSNVIPCRVQSSQFISQLEALFDDWDDANALASSTSRIALSPVVTQLQAIRRQVTDLNTPACASEVKRRAIAYMDKVIEGYIAFMTDQPESEVSSNFTTAKWRLTDFASELSKLKSGLSPYEDWPISWPK